MLDHMNTRRRQRFKDAAFFDRLEQIFDLVLLLAFFGVLGVLAFDPQPETDDCLVEVIRHPPFVNPVRIRAVALGQDLRRTVQTHHLRRRTVHRLCRGIQIPDAPLLDEKIPLCA